MLEKERNKMQQMKVKEIEALLKDAFEYAQNTRQKNKERTIE